MARRKNAGPRNARAGAHRDQRVRRGGGTAAGASPTGLALVDVIAASSSGSLLERLGRRGLELLRGAIHVTALEEVLENRELVGRAERGGHEVRHVVEERIGLRQRGRKSLRDLVRVDVLAHVLVRRREATSLR